MLPVLIGNKMKTPPDFGAKRMSVEDSRRRSDESGNFLEREMVD